MLCLKLCRHVSSPLTGQFVHFSYDALVATGTWRDISGMRRSAQSLGKDMDMTILFFRTGPRQRAMRMTTCHLARLRLWRTSTTRRWSACQTNRSMCPAGTRKTWAQNCVTHRCTSSVSNEVFTQPKPAWWCTLPLFSYVLC